MEQGSIRATALLNASLALTLACVVLRAVAFRPMVEECDEPPKAHARGGSLLQLMPDVLDAYHD